MTSNQPEKITLISAANSKFFPGLLIALGTAIEHASGSYDYDVKVLNGGLTDDEMQVLQEKLQDIGKSVGVSVTVENRILTQEELSILPSRRGSPLTNARLLVPRLFPQLEKAVYLDSDVLFGRGVEEFYQALDDLCALSACLDPHRIIKSDRTTRTKMPRKKWHKPYFNAGVIGINVNSWRRDFSKIAALLSEGYEWKHADQSLLNFLYCDQWNLVTPEANICLTLKNCAENDFADQAVNIHYIGPVKPWLTKFSGCYRYEVDCLFDRAYYRFMPDHPKEKREVHADSYHKAKRKALWYRFFQPGRARLYRLVVKKCERAFKNGREDLQGCE
jgi:lipopolysaccharide biosynthesis glycosyltransferase